MNRLNFFLFALCVNSHLTAFVRSSSVSLENNAYSNIVVAISSDVPETLAEDILPNIQVTLIVL